MNGLHEYEARVAGRPGELVLATAPTDLLAIG